VGDRAVETSLSLLRQLFESDHAPEFAVRLWNGMSWEPEGGKPARCTLVLKHPGALRRMLWNANELSVSEAYLYDDVDIEGDIGALIALADRFFIKPARLGDRLRYARALLALPNGGKPRLGRQPAHLQGAPRSRERDRQAVSYHYDVSDDFFALWLDPRMVYSCAYFEGPGDTLEVAQEKKLDIICRKLRLARGQRLLDVGCGWGGLVIHAATRYGVDALGITLSQRQADFANRRIQAAGLSGRCRVECNDYREIATTHAYDKISSVGMFEHVGEVSLREYFRWAWRLLRPGGAFLNHGIAFTQRQPQRHGTFFDRYVFPDGELVALSSMLLAAESSGFEVRDVEGLREHYEITLKHWLARLEQRREDVLRLTDEVTYRVWRLYMALASHQFASGRTTIYQTLLSKQNQGASDMPLTRSDWYR